MAVRIGISGWRYAPWRGKFYPPGLPQKQELAYAAARFSTIELNGSFYSLQRPERYESWYRATPAGFVFAVKGSRYITHMLRLRGTETALANFFASGVLALDDKLGPFLWQLPPTFRYDAERLEAFFARLPRTGREALQLARRHDARVAGRCHLRADPALELRHAIEIRHPSFVDPRFVRLLRRANVALVVADTAGKWPFMEDVTADFVYVRLHGDKKIYESRYTDRALAAWAERIRAWQSGRQIPGARTVAGPPRRKRRDVYVYFDNDVKVHAPFDAERLARKLAAERRSGSPRRRELRAMTR